MNQTKRHLLLNEIARELPRKDWEDPEVAIEVESVFITRAPKALPAWAVSVTEHPRIVEWMRRQHWKNNKNKTPLAQTPVKEGGVPQLGGSDEPLLPLQERSQEPESSKYWKDVM